VQRLERELLETRAEIRHQSAEVAAMLRDTLGDFRESIRDDIRREAPPPPVVIQQPQPHMQTGPAQPSVPSPPPTGAFPMAGLGADVRRQDPQHAEVAARQLGDMTQPPKPASAPAPAPASCSRSAARTRRGVQARAASPPRRCAAVAPAAASVLAAAVRQRGQPVPAAAAAVHGSPYPPQSYPQQQPPPGWPPGYPYPPPPPGAAVPVPPPAAAAPQQQPPPGWPPGYPYPPPGTPAAAPAAPAPWLPPHRPLLLPHPRPATPAASPTFRSTADELIDTFKTVNDTQKRLRDALGGSALLDDEDDPPGKDEGDAAPAAASPEIVKPAVEEPWHDAGWWKFPKEDGKPKMTFAGLFEGIP